MNISVLELTFLNAMAVGNERLLQLLIIINTRASYGDRKTNQLSTIIKVLALKHMQNN